VQAALLLLVMVVLLAGPGQHLGCHPHGQLHC
jgi:hypothetical protein